jgi:hypothetical protein
MQMHATGDGAHRQFLMPGNTEFSDDEDIERRPQAPGNFIRDRHSATGKCQHKEILPSGVLFKPVGQSLPCFPSILEGFYAPSVDRSPSSIALSPAYRIPSAVFLYLSSWDNQFWGQ